MKKLIGIVLLLASMHVFAQDNMASAKPPKEVSKLDFMLGKWTCNMTSYMSGKAMQMKCTAVTKKALGGWYVQSDYTFEANGTPALSGMMMLTYDSQKKTYAGFWFDSMVADVMSMNGNFMTTTFRLVSKPTPMPGMDEPAIMRTTWVRVGPSSMDFTLEMKAGDSWSPMMKGTFKKVGK